MSNDFLDRLRTANSDEDREWLVLQFTLDAPDPTLRDALQAAAVPHWFDAEFLAALLDRPLEEIHPTFEKLTGLSSYEGQKPGHSGGR